MDAKPLIALRQQPLLETLSLHPVHGREWNSSTDQETDTIDPSHLQHGAGRSLFGKRALFKVHHAAPCSEVLAIFRPSFQASMSRGSDLTLRPALLERGPPPHWPQFHRV